MNPVSLGALTAAVASILAAPLAAQGGTATYELTWVSTWSKQTHPIDFPPSPHYSSLIGGTHNGNVKFWEPGKIASTGIEHMAEWGATNTLSSEVNAAIKAGNADQVLLLGGLATSPAKRVVRFTVNKEFSKLTLVSMIAPSPDWFVGSESLDLVQNGKWVDNLVLPLYAWDAGSDSGTTYLSPDKDTQPKERIARVTTASGPFKNLPGPIGSYTFKLLSSSLVYGCDVNPAGSMTVDGAPKIGRTTTFQYSDPTGKLGRGGPTAIALSPSPTPSMPCGIRVKGLGLGGANTDGEVLLGGPIFVLPGATWNGKALAVPLAIPNDSGLIGTKLYLQSILADNTRAGLTDALELVIGG